MEVTVQTQYETSQKGLFVSTDSQGQYRSDEVTLQVGADVESGLEK
jgi:hypothetical protein